MLYICFYRKSQIELRSQIDQLADGMCYCTLSILWAGLLYLCFLSELRQLSDKQKVPVDLDTYIKKLAISRRRILLVNDILQSVQVLYRFHGNRVI